MRGFELSILAAILCLWGIGEALNLKSGIRMLPKGHPNSRSVPVSPKNLSRSNELENDFITPRSSPSKLFSLRKGPGGVVINPKRLPLQVLSSSKVLRNFTMGPKRSDSMKNEGLLNLTPRDEPLPCNDDYLLFPGEYATFQSPKYPKKYPQKKFSCTWTFTGMDVDSNIWIWCDAFDVRSSKDCKKASLSFDSNGYAKYCGHWGDTIYVGSTNNVMQVKFANKMRKNDKGFSCTVYATEPTTTTTTTIVTTDPSTCNCKCGHVNRVNRIVGGNATEVHEYPWQVSLTGTFDSQPFCGGSIISDKWILTAAHCVDGYPPAYDRVVIGEHNWNSTTETSVTQIRQIAQYVVHPGYNSSTLDNDIALAELQDPINFSSDNRIAPICLPPAGDLYESVNATVTGWGTQSSGGNQSYELYEVTVPTMSNSQCQSSYGSDITDNMICAGLSQGGKDSCQGDSGGPMVTAGNSAQSFMVQIGIVSWGYGCASPGYPGVYTRVNNYLSWISNTTDGSSTCPSA